MATALMTFNSFYPYLNVVTSYLQTKYCIAAVTAGYLFEIPYITSAITSPIFGFLIDKFKRRVSWIMLANISVFTAYVISISLKQTCPDAGYGEVVPLVLIGFSYSLAGASIWPTITLTVERKTLGTAFGISVIALNTGRAIIPTVGGMINSATLQYGYGFVYEGLFWLGLSIVSIIIVIFIYIFDRRDNWRLEHQNTLINKSQIELGLLEDQSNSSNKVESNAYKE